MNTMVKQVFNLTKITSLVIATAFCWPVAAQAQGAKSLEGVWEVAVTIRNCVSGAEIRSLPRMITFAKGGTLSETAAGGTEAMPALRTPGHGTWQFEGSGRFSYSLTFILLTSFGGPNGHIDENRVLQVAGDGNSYQADGIAVITFPNGNQSPPICATEAGTRLY